MPISKREKRMPTRKLIHKRNSKKNKNKILCSVPLSNHHFIKKNKICKKAKNQKSKIKVAMNKQRKKKERERVDKHLKQQ